MMWIQYASVLNICQAYFRTSALAIDWLSMVYMAVYIPVPLRSLRPRCVRVQRCRRR